MSKRLLNFSDVAIKRGLLIEIGALQGLWSVELKPRKQTRSLDQNSYWHVAVVGPFRQWCCEEWQENVGHEDAHEMLAAKILGFEERIINGETIKRRKSTRNLDTAEFSKMVEDAARWLAELSIVVIPSDLFYEGATNPNPLPNK